jgi:HK97 family phage major capsid protein
MTTTPTTPREFEDYVAGLDSPQKFAAAVKDGTFKNQVTGYVAAAAEAKNATMADIQAQVKEETQIALAELLKDKKSAKALALNPLDDKAPAKYSALENKRAVGAPLNGVFSDLGEYMQATWHGNKSRDPEVANKLEILNTYQEKVPADGGFLVPEEFRAELLRLSLESAVVRPRARVVPMSSLTLRFPAIDETSRVSSVFGGIVVYRTEEGAELTESQASFASIKLEATKQTALAHVTNELVRDAAGGFAMYIEQMFPEAIAHYEDLDFLTGSGVGEPLGALATTNGALISVAKESAQTATTIVWENVLRMYARMLPQSLNRAVWVVSPDAFVELATMALSVGTGGSAVWITDGTQTPTLTLLGRPVILSEKAPAALGTQGDISFVDFGYYLIGDRQMMTVDSSEHVKFTSDKTTFRVIQRNDGRPWLNSAITPANNSATLSPFVQLATRA